MVKPLNCDLAQRARFSMLEIKQILCVLSVCGENKYQISPLLGGSSGHPFYKLGTNWSRTKVEHRQIGHELKNKAIFRP